MVARKAVKGWLLRNCFLDDLTGRKVDQAEAEMFGAVSKATHEAGAVLRIIRCGAWVDVDEVVFERAVDQHGELARRGGDGFGFADAEGHPPIERA